jgi:hypothetical protein
LKAELADLLDELEQITRKLDVPLYRRRNVRWLERNLAIRNSGKPGFDRALEIIGELLQNGVTV